MEHVKHVFIPVVLLGIVFIVWASSRLMIPGLEARAISQNPQITPLAVDNPNPMIDSSNCAISPGYPANIQQWCGYITKSSTEQGIDPNLIAAIMLQESGGDRNAYSSSGAVGLLQVMPRDGIAASFMCINGPCFSSRPSMQELYDPAFNIDYGARMVSGLLAKYGGAREALRAYGPMDIGYHYADLVLNIYQTY